MARKLIKGSASLANVATTNHITRADVMAVLGPSLHNDAAPIVVAEGDDDESRGLDGAVVEMEPQPYVPKKQNNLAGWLRRNWLIPVALVVVVLGWVGVKMGWIKL